MLSNWSFKPSSLREPRQSVVELSLHRGRKAARLNLALGFTWRLVVMRRICFVVLMLASGLATAKEREPLNEKLARVLLCENEPSSAVSWLNPRVGEDSDEAKITSSGEEIEYRIDVQLKEPIRISGASTDNVTWQVEGSDFGGIIYAEFEGDPQEVAEALKLHEAKGEELQMGKFLREIPDGSLCPPTILLTPTSGSHFKLGCGWCNGG